MHEGAAAVLHRTAKQKRDEKKKKSVHCRRDVPNATAANTIKSNRTCIPLCALPRNTSSFEIIERSFNSQCVFTTTSQLAQELVQIRLDLQDAA